MTAIMTCALPLLNAEKPTFLALRFLSRQLILINMFCNCKVIYYHNPHTVNTKAEINYKYMKSKEAEENSNLSLLHLLPLKSSKVNMNESVGFMTFSLPKCKYS